MAIIGHSALALTAFVSTAAPGCSAQPAPSPNGVPFDTARLANARTYLRLQVDSGAFPGGVLVVGHRGTVVYTTAVGHYGINDPRPVTEGTVYDLASLTKVVGLTTAVMLLVAERHIDLDDSVTRYLPDFAGAGKESVTIRHLLTHTSGLPPWRPLHLQSSSKSTAIDTVLATPLQTTPGERYAYSDLGAITLGLVVERVSGISLDRFLAARVFSPLEMHSTRYRPPAEWTPHIAPTENDPWRQRLLRGEVHDENAARLDGVAGHAGLFSNAPDLARFAAWLLDAYHDRLLETDPVRVPATVVREFVKRQRGPSGSTRALGWDTPSAHSSSAGTMMSRSSFGHTGFTGTSIWIDPEREVFVILLTNRVHPTRENNAIRAIRAVVADSVMVAWRGRR